MIAKVEGKAAAENIASEETGFVRLCQRFLALLVNGPDLAMNVVVAARAAHRVRRDRHAFEHRMRVVTQDVAILERAGLPLVGITDEIFLALILLRHEAPLEPSRKTSAAAAA